MLTLNCQECGTPFETNRRHSKYCSDRCKTIAFNKRKQVGLSSPSPLPMPTSAHVVEKKIDTLKNIPAVLDPAAQFIINTQKERIDELKDELKTSLSEKKQLEKDLAEKEKELTEAQRVIEAKPTGLNGFLANNPTFGEKLIEAAAPILQGITEKIMQPRQIGEVAEQNEVYTWLASQPQNIQTDFVNIIKVLNQTPDKISERLQNILRSMMHAQPKQTERLGRLK